MIAENRWTESYIRDSAVDYFTVEIDGGEEELLQDFGFVMVNITEKKYYECCLYSGIKGYLTKNSNSKLFSVGLRWKRTRN